MIEAIPTTVTTRDRISIPRSIEPPTLNPKKDREERSLSATC